MSRVTTRSRLNVDERLTASTGVATRSVTKTKIRSCLQPTCRKPRVILDLPDGRRGRYIYCRKHTPFVLQKYICDVKTGNDFPNQSSAADPQSENLNQPASTNPKISLKPKCGAWLHKKETYCGKPAGWGTSHVGYGTCKLHGGSTPGAGLGAARQEASERAVVMGLPIAIDPLDALIHCVRITAGEVEYATVQVAGLEQEQALIQQAERTEGYTPEGRHAETKTSSTTSLHAWIRTRQDAVDRLARYSKMAIDAGVEERQVRIAEAMGTTIGRLVQAVLGQLALTAAQKERAPLIVARQMSLLTAGQAE